MTPLFKKSDPVDKIKYRQVRLLSHVSKVYDDHFQSNQYIPIQISTYFKPYFSSFLTNFRKSNISNKKFLYLQIRFYDNCMVLNLIKYCYMSLGSNPDKIDLILEDNTFLRRVCSLANYDGQ